MAFVERFRAKATKARQVQSRLKALEKMAVLAPARAAAGLSFDFADPPPGPDPLLVATTLGCGYRPTAPWSRAGADRPARRADRRAGPQRRRQEHAAADAGRRTAGTCRRGRQAREPGDRLPRSASHRGLHSDDSALDHLRRLAPLERETGPSRLSRRVRLFRRRRAAPGRADVRRREVAAGRWRCWRGASPASSFSTSRPTISTRTARDALADALAAFDGALLLVVARSLPAARHGRHAARRRRRRDWRRSTATSTTTRAGSPRGGAPRPSRAAERKPPGPRRRRRATTMPRTRVGARRPSRARAPARTALAPSPGPSRSAAAGSRRCWPVIRSGRRRSTCS